MYVKDEWSEPPARPYTIYLNHSASQVYHKDRMFIAIYLFWNYLSPFPWWLGPVLQVVGIFLLWTTRLTYLMYPKWGRRYYVFCSIVRPIGIALIAWAWVEIFSVQTDFPLPGFLRDASERFILIYYLGLLFFALTDRFLLRFMLPILIFCFIGTAVVLANPMLPGIIGFLLSLAFSGWSIISLGFRRSFLYTRIDDPLIIKGPYEYFRHPQLLSAILVNLSAIEVFIWGYNDARIVAFQLLNSLLLIIGLYFITRSEDRDLAKRLGDEFFNYQKQVPGFWSYRKRPHSFKWGNTVGICLISWMSACGLISISEIGVSDDQSRIIYSRQFSFGPRSAWHVQSSLEWLARSLDKKDGKFPNELEIPDQIKESLTNRIFFPGPVTVFYCEQKYILTRIPPKKPNPRRRLQPIKAVQELPFKLECNFQKVELAGAYNLDEDDFISVILVTRNGDTVDVITAADDLKDQYAGEIMPRLKQGTP